MRSYTLRVVRLPLSNDRRAELARTGELPADHLDRSAVAENFIRLDAESDEDACIEAIKQVPGLAFYGETALVYEHTSSGWRQLIAGCDEGPIWLEKPPIPPEDWFIDPR